MWDVISHHRSLSNSHVNNLKISQTWKLPKLFKSFIGPMIWLNKVLKGLSEVSHHLIFESQSSGIVNWKTEKRVLITPTWPRLAKESFVFAIDLIHTCVPQLATGAGNVTNTNQFCKCFKFLSFNQNLKLLIYTCKTALSFEVISKPHRVKDVFTVKDDKDWDFPVNRSLPTASKTKFSTYTQESNSKQQWWKSYNEFWLISIMQDNIWSHWIFTKSIWVRFLISRCNGFGNSWILTCFKLSNSECNSEVLLLPMRRCCPLLLSLLSKRKNTGC